MTQLRSRALRQRRRARGLGATVFVAAGVWFSSRPHLVAAQEPTGKAPVPWHLWSSASYVQIGVGLDAEMVASPGAMCDSPGAPCILGSGAGINLELGVQYAKPIYLGLAYTLTKQDSARLYRLATLQQARIELRRYFETGRVVRPYGGIGPGLALYGDQWSADTWGPSLSIPVGVEIELSPATLIHVAAAYRIIYFSPFRDSSQTHRDGSLGQLLGFTLSLDGRDLL